MNAEDSTKNNSTGEGKETSNSNSTGEIKDSGSSNEGARDGENEGTPSAHQGGSSGGDGNEPPPNPNQNHVEEDEQSDDEDSPEPEDSGTFLPEEEPTAPEEEHIILEEETVDEQQAVNEANEDGQGAENEEDEDIKPNLAEFAEAQLDLPKPVKRGFRSRRGRRGRRKSTSSGPISRPVVKRSRKPRVPKVYKPTEMKRRERKVNEERTDIDAKMNMGQKVILQSVTVKQEDTAWDKEVAATLQSVIKNSKKAKKYKAVGRPRKRSLEGDEAGDKKVRSGVMAYPIIEIKKTSENDWDAKAKYTIPGFCCNDCGAVYQSTAALRRHQNYECGKEPQFKCNECDYAAKHKGTLKSHIKNRHLPKGAVLDDTPKKPRKPRRPRVSFIPPPVPSPT